MLRLWLAGPLVGLAISASGCGSGDDAREQGKDCGTPITFEGQRYDGYLAVDEVAFGRQLGVALGDECDDGDRTGGRPSWTVYALPGVPTGQAVVIKTDRGGVIRTAVGLKRASADPDLKRLWPPTG